MFIVIASQGQSNIFLHHTFQTAVLVSLYRLEHVIFNYKNASTHTFDVIILSTMVFYCLFI